MAILQHTASAIAVLADSGITRPSQLDGKTYAGFGYATRSPRCKAVIKADGGTGTFKTVQADSTAYEALYEHKADFTIPFLAWEGVEAAERGIKLRTFAFSDYGFPDFYQVVLACSTDFLARHPDVARRFLAATQRGFAFAATDPVEAAAILVAQNPGVFDANPKLPVDSAKFLASGGYLVDASGQVGHQTLDKWTAYSKFLYDQGLLTDPDGKPLEGSARLRVAVHERVPALIRRLAPPVVLVVVLLAAWEAYARSLASGGFVLPAPSRIADAPCGTSATWRYSTPSRRWVRPRWGSRLARAGHRGRRRSWTSGRPSVARCTRCSSAARPCRSSSSPRSSSCGSASGWRRRSW